MPRRSLDWRLLMWVSARPGPGKSNPIRRRVMQDAGLPNLAGREQDYTYYKDVKYHAFYEAYFMSGSLIALRLVNAMNEHEEMFARNFILPKKRDRYLSLLDTPKGRAKLAYGLNHCGDIDRRYATLVPVGQQYSEAIEKLLRQKGALDRCHVMSSNPEIDEGVVGLSRALEQTIGMGMGTLISCIPGKLAYFEYEDAGERYILER